MEKYLSPCIDHQNIIKFIKYISLVFILLGSIMILASCSDDSQNDNAINADDTSDSSGSTPTKVVLYDPKSLFISNTSSSEVAAASQTSSIKLLQITPDDITGQNKLYQITQDDEIFEVPFLDEYDSELEVMTIYIEYLNASYIYIEFEVLENAEMPGAPPPSGSPSYCALINLESGIIYDLSEFSGMGGIPSGSDIFILGITNNLLFLISNLTLYNIDLSTMVATPMNNPEYDPLEWTSSFFIYYNESLNKTYVALSLGGLAYPESLIKVYCTDNSVPVETLIGDDYSDMYWVAYNYKIYSDNNVYLVNGIFTEVMMGSFEREISSYINPIIQESLDSIKIYQISIDDTKIPTVELISTSDLQPDPTLCSEGILDTDYTPGAFYTPIDSSTIYLFGKTGKISIVSNNGSVTAQFESIDFSEISSGIYNQDFIYYELNDSIKRASISDGTIYTILTDSNLIDWYIAGDFIFYTKYITATQVNTYKILKDGTGSPELVSSSDMEIIQVVELTL